MTEAVILLLTLLVIAWISGYTTCKAIMEYRGKLVLQKIFEESRKQKIRELYGDKDDQG